MGKLGGRKFILAVAAMAVAATLAVLKIPLTTEMVSLLLGVVASFTVGNSLTKKLVKPEPKMISLGQVEAPAAAAAADPMLEAKIDALSQNMLVMSETLMSIKEDTHNSRQILVAASQHQQGK